MHSVSLVFNNGLPYFPSRFCLWKVVGDVSREYSNTVMIMSEDYRYVSHEIEGPMPYL